MQNQAISLSIPFNPKYSHCTKLNHNHYLLFLLFYQLNTEIRSSEIRLFLFEQYRITIEKSWINQKLSQAKCKRPLGRPNKQYVLNRKSHFSQLEKVAQTIEQIGIPFIISLMDAFGFTQCMVDVLALCIEKTKNPLLSLNQKSLQAFIHTLSQLILDQRVSNFEEALRSQMYHSEMSMTHVRKLVKSCESLYNVNGYLYHGFFDYWVGKLKELGVEKHQIYIDGHGVPYYTKDASVCGRMSITGKITP